jgi:hypothetical protein
LPIVLDATDSDGDLLSFTITSQPSHGSLSGVPPRVTYTPAAGYTGPDAFSFKANDGFVDSNIASVNIAVAPPATLISVASRKVHGGAGAFDADLPLAGTRGIECRSGGANGDYMLVFTFANTLTNVGGASVTSGTGLVSSSNIDSNDARSYIVNITGVSNAQVINISVTNVTDSAGDFSPAVAGSMGILLGDINASGRVDAADVSSVRQQTLQPVTTRQLPRRY